MYGGSLKGSPSLKLNFLQNCIDHPPVPPGATPSFITEMYEHSSQS